MTHPCPTASHVHIIGKGSLAANGTSSLPPPSLFPTDLISPFPSPPPQLTQPSMPHFSAWHHAMPYTHREKGVTHLAFFHHALIANWKFKFFLSSTKNAWGRISFFHSFVLFRRRLTIPKSDPLLPRWNPFSGFLLHLA